MGFGNTLRNAKGDCANSYIFSSSFCIAIALFLDIRKTSQTAARRASKVGHFLLPSMFNELALTILKLQSKLCASCTAR